jgi:multisubunit Na+/H+ antiporter MnhB subunit
MKWGPAFGTTFLVFLIVLYQWSKLKQNQKKEKVVLMFISSMGWLLAILLIFFPNMPGPSELIDYLYRPLGKLLE